MQKYKIVGEIIFSMKKCGIPTLSGVLFFDYFFLFWNCRFWLWRGVTRRLKRLLD